MKNIHLQNFQSHKDTKFSLTPGINVIVGPTNSGKSSIMRALRKVIRNDPLGNFFITWGEKQSSITIDNVERVVSISGADVTSNVIILDDGTDKKTFRNGRGLPPEETLNDLGISYPVTIDGIEEDFNCFKQKQPSFLIDQHVYPPSRIAKIFDYLSGVGLLNLCMFEVKTRVNNLSSRNKQLVKEKEVLQISIDKLSYINTLRKLKDLSDKLQNTFELRDKLLDIRNNINLINSQKRVFEQIIKKSNTIRLLLRRVRKLQIINTVKFIDNQMPTFASFDLITFKSKLKRFLIIFAYKNIENKIENIPDFNISPTYQNTFNKLILLNFIIGLDQEIHNAQEQVNEIDINYKNLLRTADICPLCKRPL